MKTAVPDSFATHINSIAARAGEWRDLLARWCEINSGSKNPAGLALMLAALREAFGALPYATCDVAPAGEGNPGALRVRCRPECPAQLLLNGHYDTVFGRESAFQKCTQIDAETLRGPGVIDMKGGIVILLAALQAFEATPVARNIGWEILLTPDEEIGSAGSAPLLAEAAGRFDFGLIFETAFGPDIVRSRMGTGVFTLTVRGKSAHAGRDFSKGRNAIVALARAIDEIDAINREFDGVIANVGAVTGGGVVNIVPDLASCDINLRVNRAEVAPRVEAHLRHIADRVAQADGVEAEVTGHFSSPPMMATAEGEAMFAGYRECAAMLGIDVDWRHSGGGSDGNKLSAAGLPVLDGLGAIGSGLHSDAEQVHLPSLVTRAQTAALFLMRLAAGGIRFPRKREGR